MDRTGISLSSRVWTSWPGPSARSWSRAGDSQGPDREDRQVDADNPGHTAGHLRGSLTLLSDND